MSARPTVDVVVPFKGTAAQVSELIQRFAALRRGPGDSLTVAANQRDPRPRGGDWPRIVAAPPNQTPARARNAGASGGSAEWVLFLDADVDPPPDLLDRYFELQPGERTAALAGGIVDESPRSGEREPPAARWARLTRNMSQDRTIEGFGRWGFPATANCAFRRAAFEGAQGFREELRAGEDADLWYRLRADGWQLERREAAAVVHRSRRTLRGLFAQELVHGAGSGWLEREYPGAAPPHRLPGLLWWGARHTAAGLARAARAREGDIALQAALGPPLLVTRELARRRSNIVPADRPR